MTPFWIKISIIVVVTWMFYYVLRRFFVLFHNDSKIIPLIMATILSCLAIWAFFCPREGKIVDIISTFAWRLFVLSFLLFLILAIEHIVSIRHKVNPWVFIWIIIIILLVWAYFSLHTKITNLNIKTDKVQKNVKILLVSDIHAENIMKTFHINKILNAIESEKPDFVIIAWDLMNKANKWYVDYFSTFKLVKNTPIFAVIWNHDVMWNTEIVKKIPDVSNIKFLNNESVEIAWINLIWIIDKSLWWDNSLNDIMNKIRLENDSNFSILVTHQPINLGKLQNYPIDLEVAWHTHRGQFYWMRKIAELANDYWYWEYKLWDITAFVTQWIWTWWLPFRLWTQSEMVIINLIKK